MVFSAGLGALLLFGWQQQEKENERREIDAAYVHAFQRAACKATKGKMAHGDVFEVPEGVAYGIPHDPMRQGIPIKASTVVVNIGAMVVMPHERDFLGRQTSRFMPVPACG
jgi:hypothetical protein